MANQEMASALQQVFCQVLEEQMFLFADSVELEDINFTEAPMVELLIRYSGDAEGGMVLVLPLSLCREITASVLGIEECEIAEGMDVIDSAKELINMTCGQFLTTYYGDKPVMNLDVPHARQFTDAEFAEMRASFSGMSFWVDEHPVLLSLID